MDCPLVMPGLLKVLIEGARGLPPPAAAAGGQPFYLLECGAARSRSRAAAAGGGAPVWNTAHKFALSNEVAVRVVIKDEATKAVIGEAAIDLTRCASIKIDAAHQHPICSGAV